MQELAGTQGSSDYPLYNIGAVSRMTGISIATLRMWEHRYGFPRSGRTAGGHRLYSERDVLRLRWVKAQIGLGLQTAQAIQALRRAEEQGTPLDASGPIPPSPPAPGLVLGAGGLQAARDRLTAALARHDTESADRVLGELLVGQPLSTIIFDVIVPLLDEIGQAWAAGSLSVATEHLATNYIRHRLLTWMLSGPPPLPVRPTVLAAAPGELHEGSLLILGALLRRRRWPVAYLGQTLPLEDLAALVRDLDPPAVVVVAMREETAAGLVGWTEPLHSASDADRLLGFGGRIFCQEPAWRERIPGTFLGETLPEGLESLDRYLQRRHGRHLG